MNKEVVLFIAYEACRGRDFGLWKKNPFQYQNAVRLISINLLLHLLEVILLIGGSKILPLGQISIVHYMVMLFGYLLMTTLLGLTFSKRVLARSIRLYKNSGLSRHSKLIAFGYLFANLSLLIFIFISQNH